MRKTVPLNARPQKPRPEKEGQADQWVQSRSTEEAIKRLTIDVPESLHKRMKIQCAIEGLKMADVVRELLEKRFEP